MKAIVLLFVLTACSGVLLAQPAEGPPAGPKPEQDLGEAKIEKPVKMEKKLAQEDDWTRATYGVIGQFVHAPSVLDPISPLAKPEAGWGESDLSKDTVTGRIMGLRLIKFEF